MGKEELGYRVHSKEKENCNKGEEILFTCIKLIPCSFKSLYLFKYSLCLKCLFSHSPVAVGIWPGSSAFALKDEGEGFSPYTLTLTPYILWCSTVRNHAFVSLSLSHTHTHTHTYIYNSATNCFEFEACLPWWLIFIGFLLLSESVLNIFSLLIHVGHW